MRRFRDPGAFVDRARAWLLQSEAEHNLLLGIVQQLLGGEHLYHDPILLATVEGGDGVVGCAFRTPPFKFGLTRVPLETIPAIVEMAADLYDTLPSVLGPHHEAKRFADCWAAARGLRAEPGMRQRIYQLDAVRPPPDPPAGRLRAAKPEDLALAAAWANSFTEDTGVPSGDPDLVARMLIDEDRLAFWDSGEPTSMAAGMVETPHGVRVGFVYTPPAMRGRGYATACVAALSQRYLDRGRRFCFLYTDLSNPTSNTIYQRIGYQPVCDVMDYDFT